MNEITALQVIRYEKFMGCSIIDAKKYLQNLSPEKLDLVFKALEVAKKKDCYKIQEKIIQSLKKLFD